MPVPFIMPKFDMDQEKATIVAWTKGEGDFIKAEETVLVVETEKIAIDVPAPDAGILAGICYQAGDVVPIATVIAYILKPGETLADLPKKAEPQALTAPLVASAPVTPVAARMAKEKGIDLSKINMSGDRITREDVERYLSEKTEQIVTPAPAGRNTTPATPAARRLARENFLNIETIQGSGPSGRVQAADVQLNIEKKDTPASSVNERPARLIPLVGMRQKIADRMTTSFRDIPHIALNIEADATNLESTRKQLSHLAEKSGAGKLTVTALLVKIIAWALERNPYLNSSLQNDQIYLWQDINIGVATAVPDGLIVPVIHHADKKSIHEIAAELEDLTTRARAGKLTLADVQNGTFTISNLGMYGIHQFRAIINPPESAILAVGTIARKPVVINEQDEIAIRTIINITLSADHRIVDGVIAAQFLKDLAQGIETPMYLFY